MYMYSLANDCVSTRVFNMKNVAYYKVNTGRIENSKIYNLFLQYSGRWCDVATSDFILY